LNTVIDVLMLEVMTTFRKLLFPYLVNCLTLPYAAIVDISEFIELLKTKKQQMLPSKINLAVTRSIQTFGFSLAIMCSFCCLHHMKFMYEKNISLAPEKAALVLESAIHL